MDSKTEVVASSEVNELLNSFKYQYVPLEDFAIEGVMLASVGEVFAASNAKNEEIFGWLSSIEDKKKRINKLADEMTEWLKEIDEDNPKLKLDTKENKELLESATAFNTKCQFLLNDEVYNRSIKNIKENKSSDVEDWFTGMVNKNYSDNKKKLQTTLSNAKIIKDLIIPIQKYKARSNVMFDALTKRKTKVKGFPFQLMLMGMVELNRLIGKMVQLAL